MSARTVPPIPEDTASAGRAFFKEGDFYQEVGDRLGELCGNGDSGLRTSSPEPYIPIPLLFLITVFQYLENLSDPQAAAALRNRVDWKYALHLPLIGTEVDPHELDDYRKSLLADPAILQRMNGLLEEVLRLHGPSSANPSNVDTAFLLDAVHALNRFSTMVRAMRLALDELAIYHPDWLKKTVLPHWFYRYGQSGMDRRAPDTLQARDELAMAVGHDGFFLLDALATDDAPPQASSLPEVDYLRHVWGQHLVRTNGQVTWRAEPAPRAN